ncbi:MBL fold metallo-hydrolase [Thalassotalea hakodatensis]|uniref:MBL fold metallo-hydrolase n=1 Tax=Thalassotalea hakodatensis TaxID=3030492 RepID=UPI002572269C|nr:MBL fold metallo-hydrolase [Thalassotalea hakodatensis]
MYKLFTVMTMLSLVMLHSSAHAKSESHNVNDNLSNKNISIKWLGGPTVLITFNGMSILTDPMFGYGDKAFYMADPNEMFDLAKGPNMKHHKRITAFPGIALETVDLVVLSHAHEDHFDQKAEQLLNKNTPFLLPPANIEQLQKKGFNRLSTLSVGDSISYKAGEGKVTFTAVTAHHTDNGDIKHLLGEGNGYWITFEQDNWQYTLYWTGDTLATKDLIDEVKALGQIDLLIAHMGRVGTTGPLGKISMGADDVIAMSAALQPEKLLPIHHSTYALYLEPIHHLVTKSLGKPYGLDVISEGSTLIYQ